MSDTIAGRSTPGSIFSTKWAVAINAPVMPALTQALASSAFTRSIGAAHRGIFLAPQGFARMIGHFDHIGRVQTGHVAGAPDS